MALEIKRNEHDKFDKKSEDHMGKFNKIIISVDPDVDNDILESPVSPFEKNKEKKIIELDPLVNVKVFLPHKETKEIATIIEYKCDAKGYLLGQKHGIPACDSCIFIVKFQDIDQWDVTYKLIVQNLHLKLDDEGNIIKMFKQIINHCKLNNAVTSKISSGRQQVGKRYINELLWDRTLKLKKPMSLRVGSHCMD